MRTKKETHFELVFISLLRDYLNLEYSNVLGSSMDIEWVIDDFLLATMLIGNDFIPQIYCMNTKSGDFDKVIEKLK